MPDIVKALLDEHLASNPGFTKTFAYRFDLSGDYPPRSYCLQYRESELDFIQRLLAEEGIAYRFEHTGGQTDDAEEPPPRHLRRLRRPLQPAAGEPERSPFPPRRRHRSQRTASPTGRRNVSSARARSGFRASDYKPATNNAGKWHSKTDQGEVNATEAPLEDYAPQVLYYASLAERHDRYAQLHQQAHGRNKKTFFGRGTVRELKAGEWFQLTNYPDFDPYNPEDAEFVVTRLTFIAANNLPKDAKGRETKDASSAIFLAESSPKDAQGRQTDNTPARPYILTHFERPKDESTPDLK